MIFLPFAMACSDAGSDSHNPAASSNANWQKLDKGLELGRFNAVNPSETGKARVHILRIDPHLYQFQLINASAAKNGHKQSAKKWCQKYNLISAINASMYQKDHKTSVSFMRSKNHINNAFVSKDKTILAFNPKKTSDPLVKMIDRECDIGIDNKYRVLFIHTPSPYSAHDFINTLLVLPIQITQAMYVEGGLEAQLYIQTDEQTFEFTGGYDVDFKGNTQIARPIPNVIGIKKRTVYQDKRNMLYEN